MSKMKKTKIDPAAWYNLASLVQMGAFSVAGSDPRLYRRIIESDRDRRNMLKAVIIGTGPSTRYRVKGANLIRFTAKDENVLATLV